MTDPWLPIAAFTYNENHKTQNKSRRSNIPSAIYGIRHGKMMGSIHGISNFFGSPTKITSTKIGT